MTNNVAQGAFIGWRRQVWKHIAFLAMMNVVQVKEEEGDTGVVYSQLVFFQAVNETSQE